MYMYNTSFKAMLQLWLTYLKH